jgi:two-component system, NtrC family, response regulator AtoC
MASNDPGASCSDESHPQGRVLLVDDEPELRRVLRRSLVRAGFEVVEAGHGRAALELARQSRFDVVISDVRMPCMGGLELLERLMLEEPELPVVLMSGSSEVASRQSAVDVGAFDYLSKPIGLVDIQVVALEAVALHRELGSRRRDRTQRESHDRLRAAAPVAVSSGWK